MPTAITLAAPASFTSPLFKPLPVIAGNLLWAYMGSSLAASQNVGSGGALSNVGPGPTWSAGYGHCMGPSGSLQAGAAGAMQPRNGTIIGVARNMAGGTSGAGPSIFSTSGVGAVQFSISGTTPATNLSLFSNLVGGTTLTLAVANAAAFKFYAGTWGGGVPVMLYNETDGTSSLPGTVASPVSDGAGTQYIGGAGGTNDRPVDMAFIAEYNSVLSKAQIDTIYVHVKDVLATRGVVC